ncbi:hypothetical protein H310_12375 [Aphanomyces invadans]|uniref:Uncharacterized protein n=1 Tax=Aphanomyces invadans TaxID=157072 RepID=A0A024TJM8_9STRA|nr:hypothetical protein H310_12375 [Aphanomyces invadans]ETV93811.1 hypothetical protein H310_12375 [Aphanomyces invadans]|eukprot:XP_008877620.1 hypothetical protein H310_12375 [Aphanomyces invadans]
MSSGYEWATSTEAFLAATSGRRGVSMAWCSSNMLPSDAVPLCTAEDTVSFNMEIFVDQADMDEVQVYVGKRKNVYNMPEHVHYAGFKRARLHW